jgi:hypothetical protein
MSFLELFVSKLDAFTFKGANPACLLTIPSRLFVHPSRPSITSDKVRVRPIRVNVLLTLDRVNLDLLCPR